MNSKISSAHLSREAVVYVRRSSLEQFHGHTESKRRQYDLAESARKTGFANVTVIDDDRVVRDPGSRSGRDFKNLWLQYAVVQLVRYSVSRHRGLRATAGTGITSSICVH